MNTKTKSFGVFSLGLVARGNETTSNKRMWMRILLAWFSGSVAIIVLPSAAGMFPLIQVVPATSNGMQTLRIGAGGFIRGGDIECDQGISQCRVGNGSTTRVVRTDTYGAYYWNPNVASPGNAGGTGAWQQLVL